MTQLHALVVQLRERVNYLHADGKRIKKELEVIATEQQSTIIQARKCAITATDLEYQLGALTMQEISLKHELSSLGQATSINTLNNWEASANEYLADLQASIEALNIAVPQTEEER